MQLALDEYRAWVSEIKNEYPDIFKKSLKEYNEKEDKKNFYYLSDEAPVGDNKGEKWFGYDILKWRKEI